MGVGSIEVNLVKLGRRRYQVVLTFWYTPEFGRDTVVSEHRGRHAERDAREALTAERKLWGFEDE
jgi:hypothetical protein